MRRSVHGFSFSRRLLTATAASVATILSVAALPSPADAAAAASQPPPTVTDPASLVNPFIGTTGNPDQPWGGQGNTFPGAQAPFGMLAWGPDTPSRPPGGGYDDKDSSITGFSRVLPMQRPHRCGNDLP